MRARRRGNARGPRAAPALGQPEHGQGDERPEQVELLLDGQRPGVLQGRGGQELGEVRLVGEDEVPVGVVEERGDGVRPEGARIDVGAAEPVVQGEHEQQDQDGGQEPLGPTGPERPQPDPFGRHPLAGQQAGDQEAGEHEEQVDAEIAAVGPVEAEVVRDDPGDGEGPQPIEGREVLVATRHRRDLDRYVLGCPGRLRSRVQGRSGCRGRERLPVPCGHEGCPARGHGATIEPLTTVCGAGVDGRPDPRRCDPGPPRRFPGPVLRE